MVFRLKTACFLPDTGVRACILYYGTMDREYMAGEAKDTGLTPASFYDYSVSVFYPWDKDRNRVPSWRIRTLLATTALL